ncbi:gag-protease polyprotein [Cucumis melo var. makuwa]|uniref:Gag-protease polyprotein n=1 Tax=Cucumis melo var. makuwa TaxID=1194695 RepID=A0A5D3CU34_CUCMM|nr:gag-protease polyprotein [Cucumis melo var. makuwa]TYK15035.1 gag-protease polyprotein [Cucumis melo var. makuwa]
MQQAMRVQESQHTRRLGVSEVTLKFSGVTASVVRVNSPLFGWIRLDVELNKDFSYSSSNGMARGRPARGKKGIIGGYQENAAKESYSCGPCCYGAEVQGFDYAYVGATAACPSRSCSGSSCTLGRARPVVGRGQALEGFQKVQPHDIRWVFGGPTKAQMWLSSLETIFRYMKCPEDQKVQCAVFMLTDRGTACLRDAKRQEFLNLEQDNRTVE